MSKQKTFRQTLLSGLLISLMGLSLQACVPTMIVGSGVAGTLAATDRRTVGTQTEDRSIGYKGESLARAISGSQGHVNVTSFNRIVLLTGEVASESMKTRVESEIAKIDHVRRVVNELDIAAPSRIGSRSSDSMITAKVIASFMDADGIYSNSIKTVTERGIVYLMGRLTEREGNIAAEVASGVNGVQRVVKVFEYISEEELARMTTKDVSDDDGMDVGTPFDQGDQYR